MNVLRNASASRTTLASLGALYTVVVVLSVLLFRRLLENPSELDSQVTGIILAFAALFPVVLLVAVGLSVARLAREHRRARPGSGFKIRLTGFFALVVLLAAVPQGIVSVGFVSSSVQLLFQSGTADAITGAVDVALDYYDRNVYDLRVFAEDGSFERILRRHRAELVPVPADAEPARDGVWEEVARRLPLTATIQVFDASGAELLFQGDARYRRTQSPTQVRSVDEPVVTRSSIGGEGVLQLRAGLDISAQTLTDNAAVGVVTTHLPPGLESTARALTRSEQLVAQLDRLRPTFFAGIGLIYAVFTAPILLLSVLAGFFLSDRIMRPIESLEDATRRVADGDYTVRILTRPGDDLGVLVVSFNRMVNELDRARRRMAQAEKVQAWQEIAQRLAHEVKNPLTPIKLTAERLQRRYEVGAADFPDVLHRAVDTIRREVDALTEMLDEFRSFSRMPEPQFYPISIEHVFAEAAAVYHDFPGVDIDLSGIASNLEIDADRGQIRRVVLNLFANAVEAADGRVRIVVSAHEIQREGVPTCRIRIEDDGPGIPPELGESLFKPYVTSKSSGTGLGLAIVERIVFDHEGGISYESAPGSGTTFVVDLPLHHPPETRRPAS